MKIIKSLVYNKKNIVKFLNLYIPQLLFLIFIVFLFGCNESSSTEEESNNNQNFVRIKPTSLLNKKLCSGYLNFHEVNKDELFFLYKYNPKAYDKKLEKILSNYNDNFNNNFQNGHNGRVENTSVTKVSALIPFIANGIIQGVTCDSCHLEHHSAWIGLDESNHSGFYTEESNCEGCHGEDLSEGNSQVDWISCVECHHGTGPMAEGHKGVSCDVCHGEGGGSGGEDCTGCHGNSGTHAVHTGGHDRGPATPMLCSDCHVGGLYPLFENGVTLEETEVCDPCHSPNGAYDGVNDSIIGAKPNWPDGVYTGDALNAGKEKWCVTCHDDAASVIETKAAPNIAGNESEIFTYGTGSGYYKTGHGLENTTAYPDSGGVYLGAGASCDDCHDFALPHIDGIERTFDCTDGCDPDEYKTSYRLDEFLGTDPMEIPRLTDAVRIKDSSFALCFRCHNSAKITDSGNLSSNFRSDGYAIPNLHYHHLNQYLPYRYRADWDPIVMSPDNRNSRMSCVSCHNVHGTTNLAMMRDGRLTGAVQGFQIFYDCNEMASPPNNITLLDSTGYTWRKASVYEFCRGCHGGNPWVTVDRALY